MKTKPYRHLLTVGVIALLLLTSACSGSQKAAGSDKTDERTLFDYLRRDPGVRVVGNIDNAQIFVNNLQGVTNSGGQKEPLYVMDGNTIGYSYVQAFQMVRNKKIASVKVLKSTLATVQYGQPASNGAVVIRTEDTN